MLDDYITLQEIIITVAISSLLCLKGVIVDFTGSAPSSSGLRRSLQSILIQFTSSIQEIVSVRLFDTSTYVCLSGIKIPVIDTERLTANQ